AADIAVQLTLGLAFKLRLRQLHADHRGQAFADVVAGQILFDVLEQTCLLAKGINRACERAAKAAEMRATGDRVDVVGEAVNAFGLAVVILWRPFDRQDAAIRQLSLAFEVNRLFVQSRLAAIEMPDELRDTAGVVKFMAFDGIDALIAQPDDEALVQKRQLAQTLRQRVKVENRRIHDGGVRLESHFGAGLLPRLACLLQRRFWNPAGILLLPGEAFAPDLELQAL